MSEAKKKNAQAKALKERVDRLRVEENEILLQMHELASRRKKLENKITEAKDKINRLQSSNREVRVSDHAIIMYFKRKLGYDIDAIKDEILTAKTLEQYRTVGDGKFPIGDGFLAIIKNDAVITVYNPKEKD